MGAICDYLNVTFDNHFNPAATLEKLLLSMGADVRFDGLYRLGESGTVKLGIRYGVYCVSASGAALAHMRDVGGFMHWLSALGEFPHRITRLDAAMDFEEDGADVIDRLRDRYPSGFVNLGRKAMQVKLILGVRPDGRETGTFYVGHRSKARATARVYDKAWERLVNAGVVGPPRTRYEITVKQDYGATLRDAAEPDRLFWHVAAPGLIDRPDDVPAWCADWGTGWEAPPRPDLLPAELLSRRVPVSPELALLASIADGMGEGGRPWLVRQIADHLGVAIEGRVSNAPQTLAEASN
jgi:hypothetical protein